jgi:glycosyltransferase involved in cell wall biosynthesis
LTKRPLNIAINARFLIAGKLEGIGWYTHELVQRMAKMYPETEIHLLFDRQPGAQFNYGPNVHAHVLYPSARRPILWYLWFEFAVPAALRRIKPDVFFSPDNYLSLNTKVPTVLACHDLLPFSYPEGIPPVSRWYYQHFWPKYLRKAQHIIAVSETTRREAIQRFQLAEEQITTIYNGCREGFMPIEAFSRLRQISHLGPPQPIPSLAQANYFLAAGSIHPRKNLVRLISAFDIFKEQTGLPHQLVIAGRMAWQHDAVGEALKRSKYRADILLTGYVSDDDLQSLTRNACASVYVSLMEGFGLPILEAMQSGVPVLTSNASCMPEIAANAALLVDPNDTEAIAMGLARIAQDDFLRKQLIEFGLQRAKDFSWDSAAEQLFHILVQTANT